MTIPRPVTELLGLDVQPSVTAWITGGQRSHGVASSTSTFSINNYSPAVLGEITYPLELNVKTIAEETKQTYSEEPKQKPEQLPALENKDCTHSLELNSKPVLGETIYPLEPERQQSVLGETLVEEISNSINPLVLPSVPFSDRKLLPPARGIYLVLRQAKVIYVGQAADIYECWRSHVLIPKLQTLPDIRIAWKPVESVPLEPIEKSLIEKLQPPFNTKHVIHLKNPSGWLEHYTKAKKLKSGLIACYPRVEGERDLENLEHWYWAYRWEEKRDNAKSDNGYVTRAVSLPRNKVEAVQLAIARGWSVAKILKFIHNKE